MYARMIEFILYKEDMTKRNKPLTVRLMYYVTNLILGLSFVVGFWRGRADILYVTVTFNIIKVCIRK
jgi:hypothetical protein